MNDIEKRALENSHGRYVVVAFYKILHKGSIWPGPRAVLYFIIKNSIFIHFVHHCTKFYDKYINTDDRKSILMMMGVVFFQNKRLEIFTIQNIRKNMEI